MIFGYPSADAHLARSNNETFFPRVTDEINQVNAQLGTIRALFSVDNKIHSSEERLYNDPV